MKINTVSIINGIEKKSKQVKGRWGGREVSQFLLIALISVNVKETATQKIL